MTAFMHSLTPDAAVLLLTLGLALIAWEMNRPGSILPGALGLLFALLACARLAHFGPDLLAICLLGSAATILLLQSRCGIPLWISFAGTAAAIVGFARIVPGIHIATALFSGAVLGTGTTVLTRMARRARRNKGLD